MLLQTLMFDDKRFTDKDIDTMAYVLLKWAIKIIHVVMYCVLIKCTQLHGKEFIIEKNEFKQLKSF